MLEFIAIRKILPPKPWTFWGHLFSLACTVLTLILFGVVVGVLLLGRSAASRIFDSHAFGVFGVLLWYVLTYCVFHGFSSSWIRFPIRIFWVLSSSFVFDVRNKYDETLS